MVRHFLITTALVAAIQAPTLAHAEDVRMFIRHEVTDYASWRKVYDAFDTERRDLGVTAHAVYRLVEQPHDVTVWHEFKTIEAARAFAVSPNLKRAMQNAGVKSAPQVWFVRAVEK